MVAATREVVQKCLYLQDTGDHPADHGEAGCSCGADPETGDTSQPDEVYDPNEPDERFEVDESEGEAARRGGPRGDPGRA